MPLSPACASSLVEKLARRVGFRPHREEQVGPVERADEHPRLANEQFGDDLGAGRRVGGRRHRDRLDAAERLDDLAQPQIFRPKIVPPLRDAMRLVDREKIDRGVSDHGDRLVAQKPLGRDIEQPQRAFAQAPVDAPALVARRSSS